ncbi:hypothetical protein BDY21DRAFT_116606 [Lineolata rhizophorae]|uniref:Uncharacterized protein n=1 Tax=Lineolata rhizophorae TaxID=578093 RepID=A0A6A6NRF1_9PEZI|nr:hypothetical protein BDY21DRAFT_116606 [Lineolata rhizophorae]
MHRPSPPGSLLYAMSIAMEYGGTPDVLGLVACRANILSRRDTVLKERLRLMQQRDHYERQRDAFETVQEKLMSVLDIAEHGANNDAVSNLHRRLLEESAELTIQSDNLKGIEKDLGKSEFDLGQAEQDLFVYLDQHFGPTSVFAANDHLQGTTFNGEIARPLPSNTSSDSSGRPKLLSRYYDKAGDVEVIIDRLRDLDFEYEQDQDARSRKRNREEPVFPAEPEFLRRYYRERNKLMDDLAKAKRDALRLREDCVRLDLLPEGEEPREFDDNQIRVASSLLDPDLFPLSGYANSEDLTRRWVIDVLKKAQFSSFAGVESDPGTNEVSKQTHPLPSGRDSWVSLSDMDGSIRRSESRSPRTPSTNMFSHRWEGEAIHRRYSDPNIFSPNLAELTGSPISKALTSFPT